jgi:predicted SprT family Zn-dependent metalloprotease
MNLTEAYKLGRTLMDKHGLIYWRLCFNRRKRAMGVCKQKVKTIYLSEHYASLNNEEVLKDTMLHEIAHALVGVFHGHDIVWKTKCIEIGAVPKRTADIRTLILPEAKHLYACPICKKEIKCNRILTGEPACGECCKVYDSKYKLVKIK